jgi:hypothetical protein
LYGWGAGASHNEIVMCDYFKGMDFTTGVLELRGVVYTRYLGQQRRIIQHLKLLIGLGCVDGGNGGKSTGTTLALQAARIR